jgi:hypothetical protein
VESDKNIMPEFNLGLTDRIKDVAGRIGRFLFGTMEAPPYMSNHYDREHFIQEPTDGEAYQPELPMDLQDGNIEIVTVDRDRVQELILQARIAREARGNQ